MTPAILEEIRNEVSIKHGFDDVSDVAKSLFHFHPHSIVVNTQVLSYIMNTCIEVGYSIGKKEAEEKLYQ